MHCSILSFFLLLLASLAAADNYIVVLKPGLGGLLSEIIQGVLGKTLGGLAQFTLGSFAGFNAGLTADQLSKLQKNPNV
jgi:hypothetical protein